MDDGVQMRQIQAAEISPIQDGGKCWKKMLTITIMYVLANASASMANEHTLIATR